MGTKGYILKWTGWGHQTSVESYGHHSYEDAIIEAIISARRIGWTPPKWWRWKDSRPSKTYANLPRKNGWTF